MTTIIGAVAVLALAAVYARWRWRSRKRFRDARTAIRHEGRLGNLLTARVEEGSRDAMIAAALERARVFYGDDHWFVVEAIQGATALFSGSFSASVLVRSYGPLPQTTAGPPAPQPPVAEEVPA